MKLQSNEIVYRRIDPSIHASEAFAHYRDASIASYGSFRASINSVSYLKWLRDRVEEYPDGNVLASIDGQGVGQLELQAPYGLPDGYINLFWVNQKFRRSGIGTRLHEYAEGYFRSWEVKRIELHVTEANEPALAFYRKLGYRMSRREGHFLRMQKEL